ncbi:MAG: ABC transporter substrate-binding protein [Desulfocucumaceae bacterium]
MKRSKNMIFALVLIFVAAVAAGCGGGAKEGAKTEGAGQVIKIGAIQPLSGAVAAMGADNKAALELAADIINKKYDDIDLPFAKTEGLPNLKGAKIQVIIGDHQGDPNVAASTTERLITQEKVVVMQGSYHSAASGTATEIAERNGIPFVIDSSSSPTLTNRGLKWTFRTWPHDGMFIKAIFDYADKLAKDKGTPIKTVSTFCEDTLFGHDSAKLAKENAERLGWKVTAEVNYKANTTSLDSEVQKLKAADADFVFGAGYISDAILFVKTIKKLNYSPKMFIGNNTGYSDPNFVKSVGIDALGFMTRATSNTDLGDKKPTLAKINKLFAERTGGRTMSDTAAGCFTALFVVADAINRAGSTNPEAIQKALLETDLPASAVILPALQGVKFDPKTHQNEKISPLILQIQDGKFVTIYPDSLASAKPLYPIPAWDKR